MASACPSCARPNPGLSSNDIKDGEKAAKTKKSVDEFFEGVGCFILGWGANAVLAGMAKGTTGFIMALVVGPLVWLVR